MRRNGGSVSVWVGLSILMAGCGDSNLGISRSPVPPARYRVVALPTEFGPVKADVPGSLQATAYGRALNDEGTVVGVITGQRNGQWTQKGFSWADGKLRLLEVAPGEVFEPQAVTNHGLIAGLINERGTRQAAIWKDGHVQRLGTLSKDARGESEALGANDLGVVVGWSTVGHDRFQSRHGFKWSENAGMVDLGPPPERPYPIMMDSGPSGATTTAYAINERGDTVGSGMKQFGWRPGLLWRGGKTVLLGQGIADSLIPDPLMPNYKHWEGMREAVAINDRNQIAGWGPGPGAGKYGGQPYRWENGSLLSLKGLGTPFGINGSGWVVGTDIPSGVIAFSTLNADALSKGHAVLWTERDRIDLNTRCDPSEYQVCVAHAINAKGQILCDAFRKSDSFPHVTSVLLDPIKP